MAPYSRIDIKEVLALLTQGLNQTQIANELGCTQSNISVLSRKYNIHWDIGAAARDQTGDKNPNYQDGMGRSTIERLTRRVVEASGRDLYLCERCGNRNQFREQVRHHKDRDRSNNDNSNLEVVCVSCHNLEHASERERDAQTGRFVS